MRLLNRLDNSSAYEVLASCIIAGTFTSWSTDSIEMFDLDVPIDVIIIHLLTFYTVSVDLNQGWYYEYKYLNGDSWGSDEILSSWESCSNGGNRVLNTDTSSF